MQILVDAAAFVQSAGIIGILTAIIIGGARGWWVYGRTFDKMERERDAWRSLALDAQRSGALAADVIDKAVGLAERTHGTHG